MSQAIRVATIPGDGIGPEVVAEAVKVLAAAVAGDGGRLDLHAYDLGARRYLATGELLPDSVLAELDDVDAILLGAAGDPAVSPGVLERGLVLRLRFAFDQCVNLRPARTYAGVPSPIRTIGPHDVDLVVVREGTEGPYLAAGGALRPGTTHEVATEASLNTAYGVERVVRDAFARAARRRRRVTLVHKTNVLTHAGALWSRIAARVAEDHPDVELDYCHADAATIFLVTDPGRFDVIVTDNLFGDILSDLAAAVTGGIGLAASANLDPSRTHPSMFEPVHGSAPDIAGRGSADPTAAILSAALLLDHLGLDAASRRIESALSAHLARRDPSSELRTSEVGDEIAAAVADGRPEPRR